MSLTSKLFLIGIVNQQNGTDVEQVMFAMQTISK
jgi:hypothetical protein